MRAIAINSYGNHEVLQIKEVVIPTISDNEVLVKVYATSVNQFDLKIRNGFLREQISISFPFILGLDFSGEVVSVGASVENFRVGDLVFGRNPIEKSGTYAEYVAVHQDHLVKKPKNINHLQAASLPTAGIAAWRSLIDLGQLEGNEKVLIIGASGGVGSLAVQIASYKVNMTIGVCSSANVAMIKELGASVAIAYDIEDLATSIKDVDLVIDTIGGAYLDTASRVVKDKGKYISIEPPQDSAYQKKYPNIIYKSISSLPSASILQQIVSKVESLHIKPVIDTVFNFEEFEEAHLYCETNRAKGKIIIQVSY
ncbi:MAG: NADP-dependent oxidoreductase [Methylacidiphilales bacterium]|nr:NADP-dependent oxidoreductase [Candidatus Methylacidiphilales bacterium]